MAKNYKHRNNMVNNMHPICDTYQIPKLKNGKNIQKLINDVDNLIKKSNKVINKSNDILKELILL